MLRADGQHAPITPNYNHSNEDKQWIMRHLSPLTPSMAQGIDNQHNNRWETLLSVDDYIGTYGHPKASAEKSLCARCQ